MSIACLACAMPVETAGIGILQPWDAEAHSMQEQGERFHTLFASDEGYFANMKLIRDREVPAHLPELDRVVNFCLAEV